MINFGYTFSTQSSQSFKKEFHRVMNYFFKTIFFLIFTFPCLAQDAIIQSNIKYYTEKVQNYLDKEKALADYYSINKDGINIYASAINKTNHKIEFHIDWIKLDDFKLHLKNCSTEQVFANYQKGYYDKTTPCISKNFRNVKTIVNPGKKLEGYKIAIDPGHIAGNFITGDIEKKRIKIPIDTLNGVNDSIEIAEGMLTYATAELLKEKLLADGAEVFMTRNCNDCSAFGKTFQQWLKDDYKQAVDSLYKFGKISLGQKQFFLSKKAKDRDKFRVIFRDIDLAKRVNLINNFKPDFTIIIHYNVDETNLEWEKPTAKNYNMTFVGGAFMKGDLLTIEKRFEFLRLLISDDLEKSILLSGAVISSFEKNLNVPTVKIQDAKYLKEGCLSTNEKGVYCRNLQLPRYIHSPLVYGETLCQDNIKECVLLNKETDKTKNERVKQVAESYYQGIIHYVENNSEK